MKPFMKDLFMKYLDLRDVKDPVREEKEKS